jgi:hypothetical protein
MNTVTAKPDFGNIEFSLSALENDWKLREESLQTLLKNLANTAIQRQTFDFVQTIAKHIALQHSDLRSAIVKIASEVVQETASLTRKYKNLKLFRFSDCFLKEAPFIKALGSGNKVIAKHAQSALQALSQNHCIGFETLSQFVLCCRMNKIIAVRERVADTVLAFTKNVINPPKISGISLFSEHDVCENLNTSDHELDDQTTAFEKSSHLNALKKGGLPRMRSFKRVNFGGKMIKTKIENVTEEDQKIKKLTLDDLPFFKEAIDNFLRDASAPVRNTGKEIKKEFIRLEEALMTVDDKDSGMSTETAEEQHYRQRFVSYERLDNGLKNQLQVRSSILLPSNQNKGSFFFDQAKPPRLPVEKKEIFRTSNGFIHKLKRPLAEEIIDVLGDSRMLAKEKAEEVTRLVSIENGRIPEFTLEQYMELVKFADTAKSIPFKDIIVKLLTSAEIEYFKEELFEKLTAKRLLRKVTLTTVINYIVNQLGVSFLVKEFAVHRSEEIAGLLDRNLSAEDLDSLAGSTPELIEQFIARITVNISFCGTNADIGAKFESENFALFEKILQCERCAVICAKFPFELYFLDWLRRISPSMYKTLLNLSHSIFSLSEAKSETQHDMQFESPFSVSKSNVEDIRINEFMYMPTVGAKKDILKSLTATLSKFNSNDIPSMSRYKIITKAIDLLKCTSEEAGANDKETLSAAMDMSVEILTVQLTECQITELFKAIGLIYRSHHQRFPDILFQYMALFVSKKPQFLQFMINQLASRTSLDETSEGLKLILGILRKLSDGAGSPSEQFLVMKELAEYVRTGPIAHQDGSLRKLSVEVIVQVYRLIGSSAASQLNQEFSHEQQILISMYMNKTSV